MIIKFKFFLKMENVAIKIQTIKILNSNKMKIHLKKEVCIQYHQNMI